MRLTKPLFSKFEKGVCDFLIRKILSFFLSTSKGRLCYIFIGRTDQGLAKSFWRRNRDGKCAEQREPDHQRCDLETAADFLFFPIVLGTFFQQIYNTADAVVVEDLSVPKLLAAVGGSTSQIINLIVWLFCRTFFRCNGGHLPVLRRKGEAGIAKCTAYRVCLFGGGQRGHLCD